ncbi:MAG: Ig-like domain-containing protein [Bacteroidota bacterium]
MKRRFTLLVICGMFAAGALAQRQTAVIKKASVDPVIDGIVDEVWAEAGAENNIDRPTLDSLDVPVVPTLGEPGETTWQGLWTYDGIYILLRVADDAFYPHYMVPDAVSWEYDKPEIYFDVNYDLEDGEGPVTGGSGHYQFSPAFIDGSNDGTAVTEGNGVSHAFLVEEPNYTAEYFIPLSVLLDRDGEGVDLTEEVGFDVVIIDRDPGDDGNRAAVWSNVGEVDGSWNNMDDCGIITFEGAAIDEYVEEITLVGGEITENNGTLQIQATVLPENASNKSLSWTINNETGKATIDKNGVVTGIIDGDVTVTGTSMDGTLVEASANVTISNQIVSMGEVNVIRNPNFDDKDGSPAAQWGGWGGELNTPLPRVYGGIAVCTPEETESAGQYQLDQSGLTAEPDIEYVFSFVAWADEARSFNVDFEDPSNSWNRYGRTTDPRTSWGDDHADWTFEISDEPTRYIFDVTFVEILENTIQRLTFQLGNSDVVTYLDSVELVSVDDMARITEYIPVELIEVSGAEGASDVAMGNTLQMSAEVLPASADYQAVKWSVVSGTGTASISPEGLLSGESGGTVTVVASAVDDSHVKGEKVIIVNWPAGVRQNSVKTLMVYPNPAVSELNVVLTRENSTVTIYNSVGMKMDEVVVKGTEHKFDISQYAAGIYFVRTDNAVSRFVK